jgi:HEAT repeat protein
MLPHFAGKLAALVLPLTAVIVAFSGCLIMVAVARRKQREKYFETLDEARARYRPMITGLLAGRQEYQQVASTLNGIVGPRRTAVLERLCLEKVPQPADLPILQRLCQDLGLVETWQRDLSSSLRAPARRPLRALLSSPGDFVERMDRLSFLLRAKSAENMRLIRHGPSWPLLVKALEDPHPDVQAIAARALGAIGEPQSLPALVEKLHRVVLGPGLGLSVRSIKAALLSFPLQFACELLPSLKHPHPRIRFLATDIIREMADLEAAKSKDSALALDTFPAELAEIFLTRLPTDTNPDVRARSAPVIANLRDPRATPALVALLEDPQWFVRLHTVRALARPRYVPQAARIARLMTDSNWRVREASAHALVCLGQFDLLMEHLIHSDDRYTREQIAEELERHGFMAIILAQYAAGAQARERSVVEQLARMGKTSYIIARLQNGAPPRLRERLAMDFGRHTDPGVRAWAEHIAQA